MYFFYYCLLKTPKDNCNSYQSSLGFDQWPICAVHLVVEAAGVTEVVAVPISPPQRGRGCSTVHTLTTLYNNKYICDIVGSIRPPKQGQDSSSDHTLLTLWQFKMCMK